jgi:CRP-like cAMP-binding protein
VDDLPQGLKVELSLFIHEQTYKKISFLKDRSDGFIAWVCPLLRPYLNLESNYIFFEGDDVPQIYFLMDGECGFVLPKHDNIKYINVTVGNHFGLIDIVGSILSNPDQDLDHWILYKDTLKRQFTMMSQTKCELLTLSIDHLNKMQHEF